MKLKAGYIVDSFAATLFPNRERLEEYVKEDILIVLLKQIEPHINWKIDTVGEVRFDADVIVGRNYLELVKEIPTELLEQELDSRRSQ